MQSTKKQIVSSAYYAMSLEKGKAERKNKEYVGKLRSNFGVDEFNLFGEGENPKSGSENVRAQYASIIYCFKSLLETKDGSIDVLIPKVVFQ